jgi:regulator of protease activity HflC (stomatin/prohibitin superfamily)
MEIVIGVVAGVFGFLFGYCLLGGLYTINQNERAVVTNFGKAERIGSASSHQLCRTTSRERVNVISGRTGASQAPGR